MILRQIHHILSREILSCANCCNLRAGKQEKKIWIHTTGSLSCVYVCVCLGHISQQDICDTFCTCVCSSCVETFGNKSLLLLFEEVGLMCSSYKVNERCCWDRKQDLHRMF